MGCSDAFMCGNVGINFQAEADKMERTYEDENEHYGGNKRT